MRTHLAWICLCFAASLHAEPATILQTRIGATEASLFIAKRDGSEERRLLDSSSLDYNPSWSRDGRWIVFTSERDGSADIYRVRPDGSQLERLTDSPAYDDQPAISPDSKLVAFVSTRADGTADLWLLDIERRKLEQITRGQGGDFRPAWSPDGEWIAFSSDRHSTWPRVKDRFPHLHVADIYLIKRDGTALKRIGNAGEEFCGSPKWSEDGKRVVAYCMSADETWRYRFPLPKNGETKLRSIEIATGEAHEVPAPPAVKVFPAFLPGDEIAYVTKQVDDAGVFYKSSRGPSGRVMSPSWSPDGMQLVYARYGGGTTSQSAPYWRKETWSRDSRYRLVLARGLPVVHPSGDSYVTNEGPTLDSGLMLVDMKSGSARRIFRDDRGGAAGPQWSPSGEEIIFGFGSFLAMIGPRGPFTEKDRQERGAQVALIAADGSGFRLLTSGQNNNGFPSFAPDGKRFVYRSIGPEGDGLRIKDLRDGSVRALTEGYDNFPVWSPRGDRIVFVRKLDDDYEVFTIDPNGQRLTRLTQLRGNDGHCAWSPDGEWILFSSSHQGFKDEVLYSESPQPYGEIFAMRADGTGLHALTDNQWEDGGPAWRPERR